MKKQRVFQSESICFIISVVTIISFMSSLCSRAQVVMKPFVSLNRQINLSDSTGRTNSWYFFTPLYSPPRYIISAFPAFLKPLKGSFEPNSFKIGEHFSDVFNSDAPPMMKDLLLKSKISTFKITLPKAALVPPKPYAFPQKNGNPPSTDKLLYPGRYKDPFLGDIIRTIILSQPGHNPGSK